MILLDITNNIINDLVSDTTTESDDKYFNLRFQNNYENVKSYNEIIESPLDKNETIEIKCAIKKFIGSGSYGKVFKIEIKKKYYALKISENENPLKFKMRYDSLNNIQQLNKYLIGVYVAGNIKCGKYHYFSIMEYGGDCLKSKIPFATEDEVIFIMRQLYNIVYLGIKYRLYLTDFKFNNIVISKNTLRLKLIDLYMDCRSYMPCKGCRIVKTYSTIEMDKIKNILDDENYEHTYHFIPLAIGLIDLLCKKTASNIINSLADNYNLKLNVKQMIPLIQISCYNNIHNSNKSLRDYNEVYYFKKKIEKKFSFIKSDEFYNNFMNLIQVRDIYINKIPSSKLRSIIHNLFSACPDDRTLEPLKTFLNKIG